MLFNSLEFLIFFPAVVSLYFLLPHRTRWVLLLIASYYFYGSWRFEYLGLIMASTIVDYFAARQIASSRKKKKRLAFLLLSISVNLGLLFTFKYLGFFTDSLNQLADLIGWNYSVETLNLLLPVGISFYTFQTLSYTIDVFNRKVKPEKHFGIFALYVSFFPQLVAGPIERPANLLPQLRTKKKFDTDRIRDGALMMLWGFFKKIVIADTAAVYVNAIYNNAESFTGMPLIFATILFAFQIYGDFSGYSDIAIGSAKILGIDLMRNFDRPYFSKNISEFWKRWHISLSTWFRDYLYIPLGGNRVVKWRWYYNLFLTFLISGLWHGAAWTFVVWGALHGSYLVLSIWTQKYRDSFKKALSIKPGGWLNKLWQVGFTFLLVNIGWVFFRANNFDEALYVLKNSFVGIGQQLSKITDFRSLAGQLEIEYQTLAVVVGAITLMLIAHFLTRSGSGNSMSKLTSYPVYIRWPLYYALIIIILLFGAFSSEEFIYFQF